MLATKLLPRVVRGDDEWFQARVAVYSGGEVVQDVFQSFGGGPGKTKLAAGGVLKLEVLIGGVVDITDRIVFLFWGWGGVGRFLFETTQLKILHYLPV